MGDMCDVRISDAYGKPNHGCWADTILCFAESFLYAFEVVIYRRWFILNAKPTVA
jgi:hypothetical protein